MKLIDKAAVVAEIKKLVRKNELYLDDNVSDVVRYQKAGAYSVLNDLFHFLDTLEVKEVDLEEELESFAYTLPHSAIGDGEHLGKFDDPRVKEARKHGWSHLWRYNYVKEIAKHFFELGLKSQSSYVGIPNIDDTLKEMGIDPDSKEANSFKNSYYKALDKFKEKKGK